MVDKKRLLTKVIMEYDNGDREYIDGDDLILVLMDVLIWLSRHETL